MKCFYDLYVCDELKEKKEEIISKITDDKFQFHKYLITLTKNVNNHIEIYHSVLLLQKKISAENELVIGVASSYDSALKLVEKMTQEVYDETKDVDIRTYFMCKQKMYEEGNV